MKTCPFCKEQVHDDAIKCRHCQSLLLPGLAVPTPEAQPIDAGKVTYIVDAGLVRFGKFVIAVLGIFILVGTYLFGIKLEVTVEKMRDAQRDLEKTSKELDTLKSAAAVVKKDVEQARQDTQKLLQDIEENKQRSVVLLETQTRSLNSTERIRLEIVRKASPEKFRAGSADTKLWPASTTLRVRFLDGKADKRDKFRRALATWLRYVKLRVAYDDALDAEIRVSFAQPGSWAFLGTDALASAGRDQPTINLGFEEAGPDAPRNYLHEIGHLLGLVHEIKNPLAQLAWNREVVYKNLTSPPNFWTRDQVDANFFAPETYPGSRRFDPDSIMMVTLPGEFFANGKGFVLPPTLSESDKRYISSLYP